MSGAARIQKQQIEVARLATPVAVLRQQLARLGADLLPPAGDLLLQNPVLLLQVLALPRTEPLSLSAALQGQHTDPATLQTLLRQGALQQVLAEEAPDQHFLTNHWLLSRRAACFAQALARLCAYPDPGCAGACALLLRAGMLVLQQQQAGAYSQLALAHWPQQNLLQEERARWQLTHLELGEVLLEGLGLDQFCVDALRYQALPLDQLLDAAPLVKLCWLAARFASAALPLDLVLPEAGQVLLGIDAAVLAALPATVNQALAEECRQLGLPCADAGQLPLNQDLLGQSIRQQDLLLRQQLLAADLLARHADSQPQSPAEVQALLEAALQDSGIEPAYLLMQSSAAAPDTLQVLGSHGAGQDPAGLALVCAPGRSALASLILRGEVDTLSDDTPALAVIDRQILRLLGTATVVCEPVQAGNRRAVLLLGLAQDGAGPYLANATLRRLLRRTLQDILQQAPGSTLPASTLLYQQRVREAVHEAGNPLTIIKNYLQVLQLKQGEAGPMTAELDLIKGEIDRVAGILDALRQPEGAATTVVELDLNALVGSMHRMLEGAFCHGQEGGKQLVLQLDLAPGPVRVLAAANALKQILTNLVKNAVEAIETTGIITISTRTNVWQQGRLYSQLTVADNGPGIAPALLQSLFSPGATTRRGAYKGSGLTIVKGLVEDQQGQVSCQSDSKGTVLTILLPLAP